MSRCRLEPQAALVKVRRHVKEAQRPVRHQRPEPPYDECHDHGLVSRRMYQRRKGDRRGQRHSKPQVVRHSPQECRPGPFSRTPDDAIKEHIRILKKHKTIPKKGITLAVYIHLFSRYDKKLGSELTRSKYTNGTRYFERYMTLQYVDYRV